MGVERVKLWRAGHGRKEAGLHPIRREREREKERKEKMVVFMIQKAG